MQVDIRSLAPYGILNTSVALHLKEILNKNEGLSTVRLDGLEDVTVQAIENLASILTQGMQKGHESHVVIYRYVSIDLSCLTKRIAEAFKFGRLFGSFARCTNPCENKATQRAYDVVSFMKERLARVLGINFSFIVSEKESKPYLLCPYKKMRTAWKCLPDDMWQAIGQYLSLRDRLRLIQTHSGFMRPEIVSLLCSHDSDRIFSSVISRAIRTGASLIYSGIFAALLEKVKTLNLRDIAITTPILFKLQLQMPQLKRVDSDEDVSHLATCMDQALQIGQRT